MQKIGCVPNLFAIYSPNMEWMNLSTSRGEKPSIHDKNVTCKYCGSNHGIDDDGRLIGLEFIGTSTSGMTYKQAEGQGADLAVKSGNIVEFYKH